MARLPFRIVKKLENLFSWYEFYTTLARPDHEKAEKIQAEIDEIKESNGMNKK